MVKNNKVEPDISFVMPCYNEEDTIGYTVPHLINAFQDVGYKLELIAVDNGSSDNTADIIKNLAQKFPSIVYYRVEKNVGYGNGILCGIPICTAPWIGFIPADGQVDAEDVVRLFEAVSASDAWVLGKVRRRFRMDGIKRKIVSVIYNLFVRLLWFKLESLDINGTPKILAREVLSVMDLQSKGWLLDPEIMIKAHYMGIKILEFSVFARKRSGGVSHVRVGALWEFFYYLLNFRFSKEWKYNFKRIKVESEKIKNELMWKHIADFTQRKPERN